MLKSGLALNSDGLPTLPDHLAKHLANHIRPQPTDLTLRSTESKLSHDALARYESTPAHSKTPVNVGSHLPNGSKEFDKSISASNTSIAEHSIEPVKRVKTELPVNCTQPVFENIPEITQEKSKINAVADISQKSSSPVTLPVASLQELKRRKNEIISALQQSRSNGDIGSKRESNDHLISTSRQLCVFSCIGLSVSRYSLFFNKKNM